MEATVLDTIERLIEGGETQINENDDPVKIDVWQMIISAGIEAADKENEACWTIGDLALLVPKAYGDDRIGDFAKSIGMEVKRVRGYSRVAAFWDRKKSTRVDFLIELPQVKWTHYRDAMRLGDLEKATEFIEEVAMNEWTTEKASIELDIRLGKPSPARKLMDAERQVTVDRLRLTMGLTQEEAMRLMEFADSRKPVRVIIQEVRDDDAND